MANNNGISPVVFTANTNLSPAVAVGRETIMGFFFPTDFEGATVTFLGATRENGPWRVVRDYATGNAVTVYTGTTAGGIVPVPANLLAAVQFFKIQSASLILQERTVEVISRSID